MVAGVVRPPALDITNEELVRSHLHAVWLAETKLALSPDIPDILDLTQPGYPLKPEIHDVIDRPELAIAAHGPMKRILDQILASVEDRKPVWMTGPDEFVALVAQRAPLEFHRSFDRWRELYNSARTQLMEANARSEIAGLSGADRRRIKAAQMQIPFLVSRSGLTQMGYEIAQRTGITMLGRAINKHYLLFTGRQRFIKQSSPTMLASA